jgi:hypothetical protein
MTTAIVVMVCRGQVLTCTEGTIRVRHDPCVSVNKGCFAICR